MTVRRMVVALGAVTVLAVAVALGVGPASAGGVATRYVATTGVDAGTCTSPASPCLTITYAVSQSGSGDTVRVAAGQYPEEVVVDRAITFRGANAGIHAGVAPGVRGPASVVKGFRSPGAPYAGADMAFDVTIDGFTISPQGDADLIAGAGDVPHHLVSLFGGPRVVIKNNRFKGGPFVSDCSYTCTTMTDYALLVQSGVFTIKDNSFVNFRRPVDISQNDASHPITAGTISGNRFHHITSRGIWLREGDGQPTDTIAGIAVTGNTFDNVGSLSPVTGGPAAIVLTTSGNRIAGNTFTGNDPGVFDQICDAGNHPNGAPNRFNDNTFTGGVDGIFYFAVSPDQCPQTTDRISRNSFSGNSGFGVRWYPVDTAPNDVDARCNWWGSADGPGAEGADRITSGVLATPWKVEPGTRPGVCSGGL